MAAEFHKAHQAALKAVPIASEKAPMRRVPGSLTLPEGLTNQRE